MAAVVHVIIPTLTPAHSQKERVPVSGRATALTMAAVVHVIIPTLTPAHSQKERVPVSGRATALTMAAVVHVIIPTLTPTLSQKERVPVSGRATALTMAAVVHGRRPVFFILHPLIHGGNARALNELHPAFSGSSTIFSTAGLSSSRPDCLCSRSESLVGTVAAPARALDSDV